LVLLAAVQALAEAVDLVQALDLELDLVLDLLLI
jgi:hypothetical protein